MFRDQNHDDFSMGKTNSDGTLTSGTSNGAYMWNSLSSEKNSRLDRREIPRPSLVGSTSTISYYTKPYNKGTFNENELGYLPGKKHHMYTTYTCFFI